MSQWNDWLFYGAVIAFLLASAVHNIVATVELVIR